MLKLFKRPEPDQVAARSTEAVDVEAQVALAYRAVLRREPDPNGLATYAQHLRDGRDFAWVVGQLANSDEFNTPAEPVEMRLPDWYWFDHEPPMDVDPHHTPEELSALWQHVASVWSRLGEADPHWSVLTQDRYRTEALGPAELAEFYESGEVEVRRLNAWLRRAGLEPRTDGLCAEYGCGVGRITHSLARQHGRVVGFDVSEPHLRTAQARMTAEGIGNVDFVHVRGVADLQALSGLDAFFSMISLQHSPPPVILDVLAHAFAGLNPGGYAFFQVPTYSRTYSYSAAGHLAQIRAAEAAPDMEMHFVPQHAVLDLASRAGLTVLEMHPDGAIGEQGRSISNTFLMARR